MLDHDRDRDSGTGRFVTDKYADAHPDTTVSEDPSVIQVAVSAHNRHTLALLEAASLSGLTRDEIIAAAVNAYAFGREM